MEVSGLVKDSNLVPAIDWSVDQGADVINLSFGGAQRSTVLKDAIDRAYADGKGAVVVAAAGNAGTSMRPSTRQYPAAYKDAIAVSATNSDDKPASFSSRGDWVDLAPPGQAYCPPARPSREEVTATRAGPVRPRPSCRPSRGCSPRRARRPVRSANACSLPPPTLGRPATTRTTGTAG